MFYTIGDFISDSMSKGFKLITGENSTERIISRTNIIDNPDSFDWLVSGELVLSTGYFFKDDEDIQRLLIKRLAEINCSGLVLKVNRYLDCIPPVMIAEARKLHFPLIEMPFGYSLSSTAMEVNSRITQENNCSLDRVLAIHSELTNVSLRFAGLVELAKVTSRLVCNPVIIVDSQWRTLCHADKDINNFPLSKYVNTKRGEKAFEQTFLSSMPSTLSSFRQVVTRNFVCVDKNVEIPCRILPIVITQGHPEGFMIVWESVETMGHLEYIALEQASVIAAIERARVRELEASKWQTRKDFFDDLLSGNIESQETAEALAQIHGLRSDSQYTCILIKYVDKLDVAPSENFKYLMNEKAANLCRNEAALIGINVICIARTTQLIILVESNPRKPSTRELINNYTSIIYSKISDIFSNEKITICVGKTVSSINEISISFKGALGAASLAKKSFYLPPIVFIEDYAVYQLLEQNIKPGEMKLFFDKSVGKLYQFDIENKTQMLETLEVYFECNGNISDAAKKLYIHRNTLIYRIDKIKSILGTDLQNPQKILEYQLGIMSMKLLDKDTL